VFVTQRRRGLKSRAAESCNFPTEKIMGAQNFNFAFKFLQNGGFLNPNFVFLEKIF